MNTFKSLALLAIFLPSHYAAAQNAEVGRLKGFAEHQKRNTRFEAERENSKEEYYQEVDKIERQRKQALEQYKKSQKKVDKVTDDDGIAAVEAARDKKRQDADYEKIRTEYVRQLNREKSKNTRAGDIPSELEEYDLVGERPRYDYKKRQMFGAKPSYKTGAGSSGGTSARGSGGGSSFPPPPPAYDDFGNDDYVPAPIDDFNNGDIPPPPPPFGDDGGFDESEFPPPPPPPPPFDASEGFNE